MRGVPDDNGIARAFPASGWEIERRGGGCNSARVARDAVADLHILALSLARVSTHFGGHARSCVREYRRLKKNNRKTYVSATDEAQDLTGARGKRDPKQFHHEVSSSVQYRFLFLRYLLDMPTPPPHLQLPSLFRREMKYFLFFSLCFVSISFTF